MRRWGEPQLADRGQQRYCLNATGNVLGRSDVDANAGAHAAPDTRPDGGADPLAGRACDLGRRGRRHSHRGNHHPRQRSVLYEREYLGDSLHRGCGRLGADWRCLQPGWHIG